MRCQCMCVCVCVQHCVSVCARVVCLCVSALNIYMSRLCICVCQHLEDMRVSDGCACVRVEY